MTTTIENPLADDGFEVVSLDMPINGETIVNKKNDNY